MKKAEKSHRKLVWDKIPVLPPWCCQGMWKAQDAEYLLCPKPSTEPQLPKHHTKDTPPLLWNNINKGREVQVLFIKLHTKSKVRLKREKTPQAPVQRFQKSLCFDGNGKIYFTIL